MDTTAAGTSFSRLPQKQIFTWDFRAGRAQAPVYPGKLTERTAFDRWHITFRMLREVSRRNNPSKPRISPPPVSFTLAPAAVFEMAHPQADFRLHMGLSGCRSVQEGITDQGIQSKKQGLGQR